MLHVDDKEPASAAPLALVHEGSSRFNERWLVRLADGAQVECVLYRGDTLCVSSQVGCAVRCPFCASGANGLARPLALAEMIGQVDAVQALGLTRRARDGVGRGRAAAQPRRRAAVREYCRARRLWPSLTTLRRPACRACASGCTARTTG